MTVKRKLNQPLVPKAQRVRCEWCGAEGPLEDATGPQGAARWKFEHRRDHAAGKIRKEKRK